MTALAALPPEIASRRLLDTRATVAFLHLSKRQWVRLGDQRPPAIRIGERKLAYRVADLEAWIAAREKPQPTAA